MDCAGVRDNLSAYIDGTLDGKYTKCVEMHLEKCEQCRQELLSLEMLIEAVKDIEMEEPPADLRIRITSATTQSEKSRPAFVDLLHGLFNPAPAKWAASVAVAGILAILVITGFHPEQSKIERHPVEHSAPVIAETPKTTTVEKSKIAQVNPEPARIVKKASSKIFTHTIKQNQSRKTTELVALAPKPKHKTTVKSVNENDSPVTEATIEEETQPEETKVASVPEPAPEIHEESSQEKHPALIKVAAAPVLKQQDTEAWMQQVKAQAAMHKSNRSSGGITLITAKF